MNKYQWVNHKVLNELFNTIDWKKINASDSMYVTRYYSYINIIGILQFYNFKTVILHQVPSTIKTTLLRVEQTSVIIKVAQLIIYHLPANRSSRIIYVYKQSAQVTTCQHKSKNCSFTTILLRILSTLISGMRIIKRN